MNEIEGIINLEEGEYIRTKNGSIFKIIGGINDRRRKRSNIRIKTF